MKTGFAFNLKQMRPLENTSLMKEKARIETSTPESELPGQLKHYDISFFTFLKQKIILF